MDASRDINDKSSSSLIRESSYVSDLTKVNDKIDAYFSEMLSRFSTFSARSSNDVLKDVLTLYCTKILKSNDSDFHVRMEYCVGTMKEDGESFKDRVENVYKDISNSVDNFSANQIAVYLNYMKGMERRTEPISFECCFQEEINDFSVKPEYYRKKINRLDKMLKSRQSAEILGFTPSKIAVKSDNIAKKKRMVDVDITASLQNIFIHPKRKAVLLDDTQNMKLAQQEVSGKRQSSNVTTSEQKPELFCSNVVGNDENVKNGAAFTNNSGSLTGDDHLAYPTLKPEVVHLSPVKVKSLQSTLNNIQEGNNSKLSDSSLEQKSITSVEQTQQDQAKTIENIKDIMSKVSPTDRKIILNFLCGQRDIPMEAGGNQIYDILVESKIEIIEDENKNKSEYIVETIFRIDYNCGTWKKIRLGKKK